MDNAAARDNFASEIYGLGVEAEKRRVLASLPERLAALHEAGALHIHDLEAFGKVYNCSTPRLGGFLGRRALASEGDPGKISELFDALRELVEELALSQSGGIGFGNFDIDFGDALDSRGVALTASSEAALRDAMRSFVRWVNVTRTRFCREPYYLTLNVGLGTSAWARAVSMALLRALEASPAEFTRPNVVFKVSRDLNASAGSPNHDLYERALACTARRMVPTYLLMDGAANEGCDPLGLNVMGCRTRVYSNVAGQPGTVGRGNVGCVSVNLPRVALESRDVDGFFELLRARVGDCCEILSLRRERLVASGGKHLGYVLENGLWGSVSDVNELASQGTYSVGFIGLADTVEVLCGGRGASEAERDAFGFRIVSRMAEMVEGRRESERVNYSLLASPGEMISGRFCEADRRLCPHPVQGKGYYTNSFHVPVDAGVPIFEKIGREAPYHSLCGGGAITYVELDSAPLANVEAIGDALSFAERSGVSYIGFNFPMDTCRACGHVGTFDACDRCGSDDVLRIRRVSGYLEDLAYFTSGKRAEVANRAPNAM